MKAYRDLNEIEFEELAREYAYGYEEGLDEDDYSETTAEEIKEFWKVADCLTYDQMLSEMTEEELDEFAGAIARQVNKDGED